MIVARIEVREFDENGSHLIGSATDVLSDMSDLPATLDMLSAHLLSSPEE